MSVNSAKMIKEDFEVIRDLEKKAVIIRKEVVRMTSNASSGHLGGSLSCLDILVALYFHQLRHDPRNPYWEGRDRFILSKGHAAPTLYVILALSGYFPKEELVTFRNIDSRFQGMPDCKKTPGVEICTGSLGQGLSVAIGMALGFKLANKENYVYVLLGDGELNEGQIWEAAMFASHHKVVNITAIIDRNHGQNDGRTEEVMSMEPLDVKWSAFGWNVFKANGHNIGELLDVLKRAKEDCSKPNIIIAETVKGKGVSCVEGNDAYHARCLPRDLVAQAEAELDKRLESL
ncbi:MAG: transketolase [Actinobacteria bacterium]|nr:transketolase [Actinomycetota bacterium]